MSWLESLLSWFRPRPPGPSPGPPPPARVEPFDAGEVIRLVNAQRAAHGLARVQSNPDLEDMARGWAREMAAANVLSHGDFHARITSRFPNTLAGEVIAAGQASSREVVDSWMGSPPHRAQLLGSAYTRVGVGREVSASRVPYWCADFA